MRPEEERAWDVVRRAYEERTPQPHRRRVHPALVPALVVLAAVIVAAVLSPPGRAVFERVREAVGVEHADPALFSLPAPGRLLVVSTDGGGVWLVRDNGFKRRLGSFADAQWSPNGLYVAATTRDHLVALDPEGGVRWTLARADAAYPRWAGSRTDTRIAYRARSGLRVVGGDGRGDRLLDSTATAVAPAWVPGRGFELVYVSGSGTIVRRDAVSGAVRWRRQADLLPLALEWSDDGRLVAVTSATRIVVLDAAGHPVRTIGSLGASLVGSAFRPHSHELAVSVRLPGRTELKLVDVDRPGHARLLFAGPGTFSDIVWSPDGTTLLVNWPTANQWLFLRGSKVHAVGNIRSEFPRADDLPPRLLVAGRWSR